MSEGLSLVSSYNVCYKLPLIRLFLTSSPPGSQPSQPPALRQRTRLDFKSQPLNPPTPSQFSFSGVGTNQSINHNSQQISHLLITFIKWSDEEGYEIRTNPSFVGVLPTKYMYLLSSDGQDLLQGSKPSPMYRTPSRFESLCWLPWWIKHLSLKVTI